MAIALVTGGTSGIGAAFARALAARGDGLVLVARDSERLGATAAELRERHGVAVEVIVADLSDADQVARVAARLTSTEEPVDLLVNNAGFGVKARLTDADLTPHDYAIDVMIRAVLHLGGAAGRAMRGRGGGHIVNVSSTAGYVAQGNYSAIKAWVTTYSESLAVELRGTGVGVTALCPGWVRTEFHSRADLRTSSIPPRLWLDADDMVREALRDVAAGKVISIPSRRYAVLITLARLAPRPAIRAVSARISASRH
jgi:short-subunit dehydrogenase